MLIQHDLGQGRVWLWGLMSSGWDHLMGVSPPGCARSSGQKRGLLWAELRWAMPTFFSLRLTWPCFLIHMLVLRYINTVNSITTSTPDLGICFLLLTSQDSALWDNFTFYFPRAVSASSSPDASRSLTIVHWLLGSGEDFTYYKCLHSLPCQYCFKSLHVYVNTGFRLSRKKIKGKGERYVNWPCADSRNWS